MRSPQQQQPSWVPRIASPGSRTWSASCETGCILHSLFDLPQGCEIVLGNGGTTVLWDALSFGLVEQQSAHAVFGEFSGKFATVASAAPQIREPLVTKAEPGNYLPPESSGADLVALTHNETSTGLAIAPMRPSDADPTALVAVDATSAAGGLNWDPTQVDVYCFAPQKCLASDGGLWIASCSPAALVRIERIAASDRWVPASLDLGIALDNSRKNQTYNTPALATIFMTVHQLDRLNAEGGIETVSKRVSAAASDVLTWADQHPLLSPFLADPAQRSDVVATIDVHRDIDAEEISKVLRSNGIVDTQSYRKLGRNQLRLAMFPSITATDLKQLTGCIEFVIERLGN